MQPVPLHLLPFVGACIVKIIVGALWYSPLLFLKPWQRGRVYRTNRCGAGWRKAC